MIRSLLLVIILFTTFNVVSQIPEGYYENAEGKTGYELKTALYNIIKDHTDIGYDALYDAYVKTDIKPDNTVWDMYSDVPGGTPSYVYYYNEEETCGEYSGEGDCFNREHSFPQSWFEEASPMKADLFHVYPTDGYVNNRRSSYPYGETTSPSWTSTNGSKVGTCTYPGYSETIFEPIDEYKGDLARSYFYMATRYENLIASWESNSETADDVLDGTSDHVFEDWQLNLLLKWNNDDPVSSKEIARNDSVYYLFQHNRNPFIDHPEYAELIWGEGAVYPEDTILFFEDFETTTEEEDISLTGWTNMAEQGTVTWYSETYNGNLYAQCSAYNTSEDSVVAWLVTPAIDLSDVSNQMFSFSIKGGYDNGATIEAFVLTNYTTGSAPWDAEKTKINFNVPDDASSGWGDWANSGEINLSTWADQKIYVAFKYTGSDGDDPKTTTWQIDSVKVYAEKVTTSIRKNRRLMLNIYPNPAKSEVYIIGDDIISGTIQIYNSLGTLLMSKKVESQQTKIDIGNFPKGLYIVKVTGQNNTSAIGKLIKE
ncbi:MAG: T9SS type A sorting domain-containing protein [Chlorobi bacterium]|nr:T9SS type A sorting domain-containing protein [Chlorobiota bacterium]